MLDITKRLFDALKEARPKDERNTMKMYPSSASIKLTSGEIVGACSRAQYYRWFQCKRDGETDPEGELLFATGDALHDLVVSMVKRTAVASGLEILTVEQAVYEHELLLSGRSDFVVMDRNDGYIHGCEIKSVGEGAIYIMNGKPKIEHLMQSLIYLHKYRKNAKETGTRPPEGWIVLYVARSESWKLKNRPHGSDFKYLWQYYMTIDDKGIAHVTNQHGDTIDTFGLSIDAIKARYEFTLEKIKKQELPDREFAYQYDEVRLKAMADLKILNKAQTATVDKWVEKGAKPGELKVDKGDYQCRYCSYKETCYSKDPEDFEIEQQVLLPYAPQATKKTMKKDVPKPSAVTDMF